MKIAHILPTSILGLTRFNDYHLVLPHLLEKDPEYREFYANDAGGLKILDNGIAEGVNYSWEGLLKWADVIGAAEIVVPDVMGDCNATMDSVKLFEPFAKAHPEYKYMGVLQGKSYSELVKCLNFYMYSVPWVSVLAVPRVLANTIHKQIRVNFVDAFAEDLVTRFDAVHFLGASNWIREIVLLNETIGRGIDTSLCGVMGLDNRLIDSDTYVPRQIDYFEAKPKSKQLMYIEENIRTYNKWVLS